MLARRKGDGSARKRWTILSVPGGEGGTEGSRWRGDGEGETRRVYISAARGDARAQMPRGSGRGIGGCANETAGGVISNAHIAVV